MPRIKIEIEVEDKLCIIQTADARFIRCPKLTMLWCEEYETDIGWFNETEYRCQACKDAEVIK